MKILLDSNAYYEFDPSSGEGVTPIRSLASEASPLLPTRSRSAGCVILGAHVCSAYAAGPRIIGNAGDICSSRRWTTILCRRWVGNDGTF